ncbi:hypothetical protein DSO57_1025752 [Entomophthora muscae]|uniref:Uncharacterized protein n=1 Tax=Entomophthora muscae TaxID=34485 RepID=A0ACC2S464_9FUNG|nr:hypothetical protein DSO57_1025752 [Entomophthora muscae]
MTLPLTLQSDRPMKTPTAAETMFTQLFGVLYITLMGMVDSMVPNSGPWFFLGQAVSYISKLAPILWWALPAGSAAPCPELPNASTYSWLPGSNPHGFRYLANTETGFCGMEPTDNVGPFHATSKEF